MLVFCCCVLFMMFFVVFFKQKTAYEMRISDWSSDVCSSDLPLPNDRPADHCETGLRASWRPRRPEHRLRKLRGVRRPGGDTSRRTGRCGPADSPTDRKSVV